MYCDERSVMYYVLVVTYAIIYSAVYSIMYSIMCYDMYSIASMLDHELEQFLHV